MVSYKNEDYFKNEELFEPQPYQTKSTILNLPYHPKPNLPNQIKPIKPNLLKQTYHTNPTKPNLLNQTKPTK